MRIFRKFAFLFVILSVLLTTAACSAVMDKDSSVGSNGSSLGGAPSSGPDGGIGGSMSPSLKDESFSSGSLDRVPMPDGGLEDGAETPPIDSTSGGHSSTAGLLTASEWNDNKYFDDYKSLFIAKDENSSAKFAGYLDDTWGFNVMDRVSVYVESASAPVAGATVECKDAGGATVFRAKTAADGRAYLFPSAKAGSVTVTSGTAVSEASFTENERDLTVSLDGTADTKNNKIQVMFVIDITGSMGDEHTYLKNELTDVITRLTQLNENAAIELALLFYRDNGDQEKFAYYDFTDVTTGSGLSAMLGNLSAHRASGGGDYPEAVDEALYMAVNKQWDTGTATKLIFHLLDAPAHEADSNKQLYSSAVIKAAEQGIRICPILASGADILCEYIVRQAAVYTGGSFIYITDHSGIGGSHYDPNIPNAVVEKLNDLLVRVISGHHTGTFADPVPWNSVQ